MIDKITACKDCKWYFEPVSGSSFARCRVPMTHNAQHDFVTGEQHDPYCESNRKYGPCGVDAALFEQKES